MIGMNLSDSSTNLAIAPSSVFNNTHTTRKS